MFSGSVYVHSVWFRREFQATLHGFRGDIFRISALFDFVNLSASSQTQTSRVIRALARKKSR
jgi:hypothetical protein